MKKETKGALGINIFPTEINIASKLSQNRNEVDKENIIQNLKEIDDGNSLKIAEKMQKLEKK